MTGWIALSDRDGALEGASPGDALPRGTLILELDLPLPSGVLLDYQRTDGFARTFSLFHDAETGLTLLHRQGSHLLRHSLPGPLPRDSGTARLTWHWDSAKAFWTLDYEVAGNPQRRRATGNGALPLPMADLLALCRGDGVRVQHPAVLWFGATQGAAPPDHAPWIGLRTPVETPRGPVAAGNLRPGDLVQTCDNGVQPILSLRRMELPSRGFFAPILLRAPYFGAMGNLLVSADQLIALSGAAVEYLFGEDEVLARAGHLIDGRAALADARRAVTACISVDLGASELLIADGCSLASAHHGPRSTAPALPRRLLHGYEAVPLLSQTTRQAWRPVA